ncbi:MAG: transporter substrate-binding domain-containing protein [Gammaproteobacteria bacterium]|nr:transporter substrate-binding domain-containing protein [Gammaproteobacteria bacterium]
MKLISKAIFNGLAAAILTIGASSSTLADTDALLNSAKDGGLVRLGFANEVPWAYPGENNEPLGFVNSIVIGTLKNMGIENLEPVTTDWAGLIPGIKANRYDIVTGGMYILKKRCENMDFSDPIGVFGDALVVPAGNPKDLHNYQDVIKSKSVLVTGTGYNTIDVAKSEGVPDADLMLVPGPTEMLAALLAGRADAIVTNTFTANEMAEQSDGKAEVTDPAKMPDFTLNWVGIGFRAEDSGFREAFNAALADYLGSDEMMAAVAEYGYTEAQLPGDATTEFACENR